MELPEMPSGMTCITNLIQEWDSQKTTSVKLQNMAVSDIWEKQPKKNTQ